MKHIVCTIAFICGLFSINAQELNCNVTLNYSQIQGTNTSVFTNLEKAVNEFVNNRRWTNMTYGVNERIECNMNIIVRAVDGNLFSAEIIVQSRRPVYNSGYTTPLFNFRDQNFTFEYKEFDQLEMNETTLTSNLVAVLAYYAYLIIGYDMDSYSRLGGTPYFQSAENIVTSAQSTDWSGWKAFESNRNRYALINNLMDEAFKKYRNFYYDYHRLGLDEMAANITNARARIAEGIPVLREANRARPSAIVITTFMETKSDEMINLFSKAPTDEKAIVVEILSDVNPTLSSRYEEILTAK